MSEKDLAARVAVIELRNNTVSLDKRWETSWTRRLAIAALTYVVVVAYLILVIGNDHPFLNAVVPVCGYLLSTLAIGWIRRIWTRRLSK